MKFHMLCSPLCSPWGDLLCNWDRTPGQDFTVHFAHVADDHGVLLCPKIS